jgi:hypothetical protein
VPFLDITVYKQCVVKGVGLVKAIGGVTGAIYREFGVFSG